MHEDSKRAVGMTLKTLNHLKYKSNLQTCACLRAWSGEMVFAVEIWGHQSFIRCIRTAVFWAMVWKFIMPVNLEEGQENKLPSFNTFSRNTGSSAMIIHRPSKLALAAIFASRQLVPPIYHQAGSSTLRHMHRNPKSANNLAVPNHKLAAQLTCSRVGRTKGRKAKSFSMKSRF